MLLATYIWHVSHRHCHVGVDWVVFPLVLQVDAIRANDGEFRSEGSVEAAVECTGKVYHL